MTNPTIDQAQADVDECEAILAATRARRDRLVFERFVGAPDERLSGWADNPRLRREFIGGSDVAAIVGESQRRNKVDVWLEKNGRGQQFEGNDLTDAGHRVEQVIVQWWADQHPDVMVIPTSQTWVHPLFRFIAASPDAILIYPDGTTGVLEAKNVDRHIEYRWVEGADAPADYLVQTIHNANVLAADRAVLVAFIGGNEFRTYEFEMTGALLTAAESFVDDCREFWATLDDDMPPEIDLAHPGARASLGNAYDWVDPESFVVDVKGDPVHEALVEVYPRLVAEHKAAGLDRDRVAAALCELMGRNAASVIALDGEQCFTWNITNRFDPQLLACGDDDTRGQPDLLWWHEPSTIKKRYPAAYKAGQKAATRTLRIKPKFQVKDTSQ